LFVLSLYFITLEHRTAINSHARILGRHAPMTIKLIKGKALMKHSLHEKTAASVLLKLFKNIKVTFHEVPLVFVV